MTDETAQVLIVSHEGNVRAIFLDTFGSTVARMSEKAEKWAHHKSFDQANDISIRKIDHCNLNDSMSFLVSSEI
jgi:hypothetical protein